MKKMTQLFLFCLLVASPLTAQIKQVSLAVQGMY